MKKYKVNWDLGGIFIVPDAVEEHLKLASGKAAKVLLEIMKNKEVSDIKRICQNTGVPEEDVEDALLFWSQVGVLCISDNKNISSINIEISTRFKNETPPQNISYEEQVRQNLGIERVLSEKERNYVKKWEQHGISLTDINSAAEKTRKMIGKTSFAYIDKLFKK